MSDSLFAPRDRIGDGIGNTGGEFQLVPLLSYESGGEKGETGEGRERRGGEGERGREEGGGRREERGEGRERGNRKMRIKRSIHHNNKSGIISLTITGAKMHPI